MRLSITFFLVICHFAGYGYLLSGTVKDQAGPVAFAGVYIASSTYGVVTNEKGEFFMQLENGTYVIKVEYVGYEKVEKTITINNADLHIEITLVETATVLQETVIHVDREDPAYRIIRMAIQNREKNNHAASVYGCDVYIKSTLEVENLKETDSAGNAEGDLRRVNFMESYSRMYFEAPDKIREVKKAYRDLYDKEGSAYSVSVSFDYSEEWNNKAYNNPYIFGTDLREVRFNFYHDLVELMELSDRPYVSPISKNTFLSYKFKFEESFLEDGVMVHRISVIPRNKAGNLFSGLIYIEDGSYAIKAVDFELNKLSLRFYKYFKIIQTYKVFGDTLRVPVRQEFFYNVKEGTRQTNIGNTLINYSNYTIGERFPKHKMEGADIYYEDDAFEQDSAYWEAMRPIRLKLIERSYIRERDSVEKYRQSEEYLQGQDSIYNSNNFWDYTLNGIRFRNRAKGTRFYLDPLISQVQPFAVGGYRHKLGTSFYKEWTRANSIRTWQEINYGYLNRDLRGSVDVTYTFLPKRFGSVRGGYDNDYEFVNNYESISATFSRSNYVEKIAYRGGGRLEIVNGLYAEMLVEHAEYRSISGLTLERWSGELFGSLNTPQEFDNYTDMVIDLDLKYVIGQKFVMKPYKKEVIGKAYPELGLHYKKGLPSMFSSTVNYDFAELTYRQQFQLRNLGTSKFTLYTGRFFNDAAIRLTNRKFFRGSDKYFFSDPLRSFQLLGPSISTTRSYFQGQYIHHFNGVLMNKIPLINRLKLEAVGGAGVLLIQDNAFKHAEIYGGLSKVFRIRSQLFKISGFYVVADSNHSDLAGWFKFGIDFYNPFDGTWSY